MKSSLLFIIGLFVSNFGWAQVITNCKDPIGNAYFANKGVILKKDIGWTKDKITGGITTLKKISKDNFDILYVDARKNIYSSVDSGAKVLLLRQSEFELAVLVYYPNDTIEIYTFYKTNDNKFEYTHLQTKGGDIDISKSMVMVGSCDKIDFSIIK